MATPVGFEGADHVYAAPPGEEHRVQDLAVSLFDDHTVSCWRLTDEELAEVNRTGVVWLKIMGHGIYPVYISGEALVVFADGEGGTRPAKAEPAMPPRKDRQA